MTAMRKDIAATVATALAVLAYLTTHEGWNVWLIGDDHRWAAAAIVLLGLVTFTALRDSGVAYLRLTVLAGLFAVLAFMTGELTPLSLLAATIVVWWLVSALRDVWHSTHHPMTA
jgi:hypothetical protein